MYNFISTIRSLVNTGQSRSIIVSGNIHDLYYDNKAYVPLINQLSASLRLEPSGKTRGIVQILYRLNNPVEIVGTPDQVADVHNIWNRVYQDKKLEDRLTESINNTTYALELIRQIFEVRRKFGRTNNIVAIIEAADLIIPESEISRMNLNDRKRVAIFHDWFCEPDFVNGGDTVILLAESPSLLHHRIARLPQVVSVEIPLPDENIRRHFLETVGKAEVEDRVVQETCGLSVFAIRQLLLGGDLSSDRITQKVEEYMISQLGEGVVEFKRPKHNFSDVIGFRKIKAFFQGDLLQSMKNPKHSVSGVGVCGPIGVGKTFLCEAFAAELDTPVIVLKNIRSKWFGETDALFERINRLLRSFMRIVVFVDEADTQFPDLSSDVHETEKRLTGKIQAMMSDPTLKGHVIWFLMTARIHRLSPDIRRPGRLDYIIPFLDPDKEDRDDFQGWAFGETLDDDGAVLATFQNMSSGWSPALYSLLRGERQRLNLTDPKAILALAEDLLTPDIEETRRYQTLQAMMNATRKSFLPAEFTNVAACRDDWKKEIARLEAKGIN